MLSLFHRVWGGRINCHLPVKCVDLLNFEVIEILACLFDLSFVCFFVNNEDEGIVIFDGLDGALSGEWVLDDGEFIPCGLWNN